MRANYINFRFALLGLADSKNPELPEEALREELETVAADFPDLVSVEIATL